MKYLALLGTLSALMAQDDFPILVYPVHQAQPAPVLDGKLDDACWTEAPTVSGFVNYDSAEQVIPQTSFRAVWDAAALYLGVRCDEPAMDKLTPTPVPHDAKQVFGTEAIEIFIDPGHDHRTYFQLAVNAAGSVYDSRWTDPGWSSKVEVGTALGQDAWYLELKIPWGPLEMAAPPAAGTVLGFNLNRDRTLVTDRAWSAWSQVKANFHDPERFGHLVLSPTPAQLAELAPEFREGDRSGPIRIFSKGGFGEASYNQLAQQAMARVDQQLAELRAMRAGEDAQAAAALGQRLTLVEGQLEPYRAQLQGELTGDEFARIELALAGIEHELGAVIWEARLEALLVSI